MFLYSLLAVSEKATQNTNNYMRNQSYSLKIRFAEFILKMSVTGYYREPHTEVAEFLGVTYRHLLYVPLLYLHLFYHMK